MALPPEPGNQGRLPERPALSPEDRRTVLRAAFLRPINLLMLVLGAFATIFFSWWFLPLTLVTYALLAVLSARDPLFERQVLGERSPSSTLQSESNISPERRARWLPRGETRRKIEETLEIYRATVTAIEDSDDVARAVLHDAIPKLYAAANRLVEVAHDREKAATAIAELQAASTSVDHSQTLQKLEDGIQNADAEITETYESLVSLRARVAQVSTGNSPENRATAAELNATLDELNIRLEALDNTMSPGREPPAPPEQTS